MRKIWLLFHSVVYTHMWQLEEGACKQLTHFRNIFCRKTRPPGFCSATKLNLTCVSDWNVHRWAERYRLRGVAHTSLSVLCLDLRRKLTKEAVTWCIAVFTKSQSLCCEQLFSILETILLGIQYGCIYWFHIYCVADENFFGSPLGAQKLTRFSWENGQNWTQMNRNTVYLKKSVLC